MQVRKLNKRVTADAARVMMALLVVKMFEMMVFFSEGGLADNPRLEKFLKDAVNGRPGNLAPFVPALFQELFRREMPVGVHDLIEHNPAPARELQAAAVKIIFIFFLFVDDHIVIQCLMPRAKIKGSFLISDPFHSKHHVRHLIEQPMLGF